jgi:hypothetical protein
MTCFSTPGRDKALTQDQFDQVVSAILSGKYSWACVLILRFAGYNPLHYIPYRTYNRLMKDNGSSPSKQRKQRVEDLEDQYNSQSSPAQPKIRDLNYAETLSEQQKTVKGGYCPLQDLVAIVESFSSRL